MPNIFGIDIASIVHSSTQGQLFAGTLIRRLNKKISTYTFEGITGVMESAINNQSLSSAMHQEITIIANSITPKTAPIFQDTIKLMDKEYTVIAVDTDPAEATHICKVSKK